MRGLLTDLYELTMAAGYFEAGKSGELATFELTVRRLPRGRNYVLAAGLPQAVEYLQDLGFDGDEVGYLRSLPQFRRVSPAFFEYLREFRFTGDVWAVPEGTVLFAGEPMLVLRAPLAEAQIPETYLLAALTFQTLIATKASRIVLAAAGRAVAEFGTRRAHTAEAGVLGGRAAFVGGCSGTSNTEAGFQFGIPVMGTAAHSWTMSFASEEEAFCRLQAVLGPHTVQLVDTYDIEQGLRRAAALGAPLWGVRIDSGDFSVSARQARQILDEAGLHSSKVMLSGDLDEWKIRDLVASGVPVDAFGVGTELATSGDAPSMGAVYKLVEIESGGVLRPTAKSSPDKVSIPGLKQLYRLPDCDLLALASERPPTDGRALLVPVIRQGKLTAPLPNVAAARECADESIAWLPAPWRDLEPVEPYPVRRSAALDSLLQETLER